MIFFKAFFVALVATATTVKGLQCWKCENAVSMADCVTRGNLETCASEEESCMSSERKENGLTFITKQCKQEQACRNHMLENKLRCNPRDNAPSVCHCCCETNSCNMGMMDCMNKTVLRDQSCPTLKPNFPHGNMQCSGGINETGTVCDFQCTEENYLVHPSTNDRLECLSNGQWNKPAPCCALPCPPYVLFDVIALIHASNNETYKEISTVGAMGYRDLIVSPENGNMYAKLDFSGNVHKTGIISFNETLLGTFNRAPQAYINSADGKVNIGNAMNWALDNMMGPGTGDRVRVRDILLIGTDSASDDDVTEAAKKWESRGALVYVMVFPNEKGEFPLYEKMLEITRDPEHVYYFERGNVDAVKNIFDDTIGHFCTNICNHVLHDHE